MTVTRWESFSPMPSRLAGIRSWFTVFVVATLMGCGPAQVDTYPVKGTVKFSDGQPVRSGTVELQSLEHGTTATGSIRNDGTFELGTYTPDDGAAAGKHKAIVIQLIIGDGMTVHHKDHGRAVPTHYGDYETSNLTAEVAPVESNQITLTLEPKKK